MQGNTTFDKNNDEDVEVIEVRTTSCRNETPNTSAKNKSTLVSKIAEKLRAAKGQYASTYSKRNTFTNALLSLYTLATFFLATFLLYASVLSIFIDSGWSSFILAITGIVYICSCYYFTYRFIFSNRKDAVWPAILSGACLWYIVFWFLALLYTPEEYDECIEWSAIDTLIGIVWPLALYVIFSVIVFGVIRLVMSLKKYGASAWGLLDVSRRKRPKYEKVFIWLFFTIWLIPVGYESIRQYRIYHPEEKYPSHAAAKIGDYYYSDGTISSEILSDKKAVGIVFSLEVSEKDRIMGYNHGQIVSLSDISPNKMQWDSYNLKDYEKYPNYIWANRMDALKDIDGLRYTNCEEFACLQINWDSMKYMENEIEGVSDWYVPTAGQWAKILENIGGVKVDRMLKFNSDIASTNLEKINIDPQRWYWTITEFDAENAWSIRLANGEFGSRSNKQNGAYVRPVASF